MRKNIVGALGLALSLAGTALAQQGDHGAHGKRPERGQGQHGGMETRMGRGGPDGLLLKGITLTEGQRTQIAQLGKAQREAMGAQQAQRKGDMEQVRAARQRGDTAAVKSAMLKRRQEMETARTQHLAAIRNLLTAEQRVQFDKNVTELQDRVARRGAGDKPARGLRGPGKRAGGR